jgi:hypothetical protein
MARKTIDAYMIIWERGGKWMLWKDAVRIIDRFIKAEKLKPVRIGLWRENKRIPLQRPFPGIPVPHVHYGGRIYEVNATQWRKFSGMVMKDLATKLAKVKTVGMDELAAYSEMVNH